MAPACHCGRDAHTTQCRGGSRAAQSTQFSGLIDLVLCFHQHSRIVRSFLVMPSLGRFANRPYRLPRPIVAYMIGHSLSRCLRGVDQLGVRVASLPAEWRWTCDAQACPFGTSQGRKCDFHQLSRAEGPWGQTSKGGGLRQPGVRTESFFLRTDSS